MLPIEFKILKYLILYYLRKKHKVCEFKICIDVFFSRLVARNYVVKVKWMASNKLKLQLNDNTEH